MRAMLLATALLGAASMTEAKAQYYPYCAYFNRMGGENCGFVSFAQCQAYVRGIGGFCAQNPWFAYAQPPFAAGPPDRYPVRKRSHRSSSW